MNRRSVSYPKEIRARAKRDGKGLMCLDVLDIEGDGVTYLGPATDAEIEMVVDLIRKIASSKPKPSAKKNEKRNGTQSQ